MQDHKKGRSKKKIGEVLLENKIINQHQLDQALFRQHNNKSKLGQILIDLGYITQLQLDEALVIQEHHELLSDKKHSC